jgi:hypothetical protein
MADRVIPDLMVFGLTCAVLVAGAKFVRDAPA